MMERFFEQLKQLSAHIALSKESKADIRARLVAQMQAQQAVARPAVARGFMPFALRFAAVIALFTLLGSGTSYASEGSLPGDILYPVKILSEEVRAVAAVSEESKASWERERAERRLAEAVKLAAEDRLTTEVQADLEARFAAHAEKVQERLAMLETKAEFQAAADLATRFEASLDAHNRILEKLEERAAPQERGSVTAMKARVVSKLQNVHELRAVSEDKIEEEHGDALAAAAAARIVEASSSISAASGRSEDISAAAPTSLQQAVTATVPESAPMNSAALAPQSGDSARILKAPAEVQIKIEKRRIEKARELYEEAQRKLEQKEFKDAFKAANEAVKAAGEAKVLKKAEKELKIRIEVEDGDDASGQELENEDEDEHEDDGFDLRSLLRGRRD